MAGEQRRGGARRRGVFCRGLIDYDGTYVYAVDAETGTLKWVNNTSGHLDPKIRKGVSAQGNLTLMKDKLWMAAGNVMPPTPFDLATGALMTSAKPGDGVPNNNRGEELGVFMDEYLFRGGRLRYSAESDVVNPGIFSLTTEKGWNLDIAQGMIVPAWDNELFFCLPARDFPPVAYDSRALAAQMTKGSRAKSERMWEAKGLKDSRVLGLALAKDAAVALCETPTPRNLFPQYKVCLLDRADGHILWNFDLPSEPRINGLAIDGDGRLIVTLRNGNLMAFGDIAALQSCLTGLAVSQARARWTRKNWSSVFTTRSHRYKTKKAAGY